MANCPKCGYKLRLIDWRPTCPKCGVNLVYYGMEETLLNDADKAETEHARFQKRIDRLKASFIGSKLTIARIVLSILPIAALMLPLASVTYSGPFIEQTTTSINAITIYNLVSSLDFDGLFAMLGSPVLATSFIGYAVSLVALLLSLVMIIVSLVLLTCACGPRGKSRNITMNVVTMLLAIASIAGFFVFSKGINTVFPTLVSGKIGFGAFVYVAMIAALLAINIVIAVKGVEVKYKQCYVGGIPYEEYMELVEKGTDKETIRKMMAEAITKKEEEKKAEEAKAGA